MKIMSVLQKGGDNEYEMLEALIAIEPSGANDLKTDAELSQKLHSAFPSRLVLNRIV